MPHDPRKSLEDMRRGADFLRSITADRTLDDYRNDEVLRSVVERKFEIIGEALNRLQKTDSARRPDTRSTEDYFLSQHPHPRL